MKPIVVFGAGGFAREVMELLRDINADNQVWDLRGFLSDDVEQHGCELNGLPIVGGLDCLGRLLSEVYVVLGVGSPATKRLLVERIRPHVAGFPCLVHPTVVKSKSVVLAEGVVITAGNCLTANISLGAFSMINLACTVGHDCTVGEYATVSPGVNISGSVCIESGCDIGTGSSIIQGVSVGCWSVVGAGAVVTTNLPPNCTAVGIPAKVIKEREAGWQLA